MYYIIIGDNPCRTGDPLGLIHIKNHFFFFLRHPHAICRGTRVQGGAKSPFPKIKYPSKTMVWSGIYTYLDPYLGRFMFHICGMLTHLKRNRLVSIVFGVPSPTIEQQKDDDVRVSDRVAVCCGSKPPQVVEQIESPASSSLGGENQSFS